ncbi:hypothetical protein [Acinetobacter soli]|uniref:hypothetical protein n=1 Tax=Acinetobacter soli TaxID=487316 RepID=UPI002FEF7B04
MDLKELNNSKIQELIHQLSINKDKIDLILNELAGSLNLEEIDFDNVLELKDYFIKDILSAIDKIKNLQKLDRNSKFFLNRKNKKIEEILIKMEELISNKDFFNEQWGRLIDNLENNISDILAYVDNVIVVQNINEYQISAEKIIDNLKDDQEKLKYKLEKVDIINNDLKNKKVHEIFEDDFKKFKKLASKYEIAFYLSLVFLFLYFFGWYIDFDTSFLKFKFAEQFHGNHSATFYVQKISLLILSTTLAAFLLKRSFMNRRLADEAYRTAKELDALPRYMEGMPDEMKEKIRFDLAYKYFGNGIHHDSYTGAENLMHENIKANTEFMKVVKGVPSTTDETKADKDKNE